MNAFVVEQLLESDGDRHVVGRTATSDVSGGDDSRRRQLPDVQLMHVMDPLHLPYVNTQPMAYPGFHCFGSIVSRPSYHYFRSVCLFVCAEFFSAV